MGAVCVLAPVVVAAWPAFSSAVVAAAASLGYSVASESAGALRKHHTPKSENAIQLEIERSEVVTNTLGRDQRISVTKEGVSITFSRDARGKAALCVTGNGQSQEALRACGEQLGQAVVQQYVYQKLLTEMQARGFVVVDEQHHQDRSIELRVRHWEG
jgi:hypothetical protein